MIKLRGIEPGLILITKKPTGEAIRSLVTVAGIDHILGGQDGRVVMVGALGGTHK
jgi:hypothetical protein